MRCRSSVGTPGPSSSTAIWIKPDMAVTLISVAPRAYLRALSRRLANTWASLRLSADTTNAAMHRVIPNGDIRRTALFHHALHELGEAKGLESPTAHRPRQYGRSPGGPPPSPGSGQVLAEKFGGPLRSRRHLGLPILQHFNRGGQRHQGRSKLVGNVGCEPFVSLDSSPKGVHHVIERSAQLWRGPGRPGRGASCRNLRPQ